MILYYSVLFAGAFFLTSVIIYFRKILHSLAANSVGLLNELLSRHEDDQKIKDIQSSTNRLIVSLFKTLLVFLLSAFAGAIPLLLYVYLTSAELSNLNLSSFYSILSISLGASLPFILPSANKNKSDYSELSQLLHRMALDNYNIAEKLFSKERKKINRRNPEKRKDFVIISGLARAGTTSLMNDLSEIDNFVSLNYANMPFLLSPNIWRKFYKPRDKRLKERSHKDGIMIGLNSNEALEEYFFKVKAEDSYILDNYLAEYELSQKDYNDYIDYQKIITLDNDKTYLAKNNNFILRYKSLRNFNNDFLMVILFRDPLSHASSLREKHREYSKLQDEDPFVLEYMNWLGHHEFGKNHKSFKFTNSEFDVEGEKDSLNYWLKIWINYYRYALSLKHPNTLFINYEYYCKNPDQTIGLILKKAGIEEKIAGKKAFVNTRKTRAEYDDEIYENAMEIYRKLSQNKAHQI